MHVCIWSGESTRLGFLDKACLAAAQGSLGGHPGTFVSEDADGLLSLGNILWWSRLGGNRTGMLPMNIMSTKRSSPMIPKG